MSLPVVNIAALCRNPVLLPSMLMVFDTIRVGFPNSEIQVTGHGLDDYAFDPLLEVCLLNDCKLINVSHPLISGEWMAGVIKDQQDHVFVDTDVVFWKSVEGWEFDTGLAGRLLPRYNCPHTRCITEPRLHPSFLHLRYDQFVLEAGLALTKINETRYNPVAGPWMALTIPGHPPYFFDTGSIAYRVCGGTAYTPDQLDCYDHLFAGSFVDELSPSVGGWLIGDHRKAWKDPESIRGAWRQQDRWFAEWGKN